jgi:hypothetical protein
VADDRDRFGMSLARELRRRGVESIRIALHSLSSHRATLEGDAFTVDGRSIGVIVFRPPFGSSFEAAAEDGLVDIDVCGLWQAAMSLPGVLAYGSGDEEIRSEGQAWLTWRRVMRRRGIGLAPCRFGESESDGPEQWEPMAESPATPAPITITLAGGILPAAVIWPLKKRPKCCAASTTAR